MQFHNVFDDGQTEAEASETAGTGLRITVEHEREELCRDAFNGVVNLNHSDVGLTSEANHEPAAGGCEFEGIR